MKLDHSTHNMAILAHAAGYLAQALATATGRPYAQLLAEAKAAGRESIRRETERKGKAA